ncbi:MAG: NUDIX hydrolase [Chloroflexota bacterium]|nr:NUDIX hydrolase [Chloroflexota bacterium]
MLLSGNRWFSDKPLVWTLPGGRSENGEGVEQTVIREFLEETGLNVEVVDLAYVAEARSGVNKRIYLTCAFTVRLLSGNLTCVGDSAVEELRFVEANELSSYIPGPSLGDPLRAYLVDTGRRVRYWFFPEYE